MAPFASDNAPVVQEPPSRAIWQASARNSQESENLILRALPRSLSYKAAAAGVGETTLHRWRKIGRGSRRQPYRRFHRRAEAAQAATANDYL